MSILYFPNRVFKGQAPAIDRVLAKRKPQLVRTTANTASNAFSQIISANSDWYVDSIKLTFGSSTLRNYSVAILSGIKVITNLNDYLFIAAQNCGQQKITLSPGFYNGTELATELQTQLNANAAFVTLGLTFTVAYNELTGLFTITPSWGNIQYVQQNVRMALPDKDSIAGHLFGLTQNSSWGATIVSNVPVWGLNSRAAIINETGSAALEHYHDDTHTLGLDQALKIDSSIASTTITTEVCYEELV